METKLQAITRIAQERPEEHFTSLAHILNKDFLKECFDELGRNRAPGIDGVTWAKYEKNLDQNLDELVNRMRSKKYIPEPVKRIYIPKDDGTKRGLGLPTIEDKIVQMGIKKILEAIYEEEFLEQSYGFRPGRNAHNALEKVWKTIMLHPVNWVADIDIEKFFDTIDHKQMMEFLQKRINDPNFLRLIGRFLKAGIMEEGVVIESDKGTPQGGVVSPILANIYLHYTLDDWFQNEFRKQSKGYAGLIRYADDFIACFEYETDAQAFKAELEKRLNANGLRTSREKSKVIEFGRWAWKRWKSGGKKPGTFDFLGFTHTGGVSRNGKFKVERRTSSKRYRKKLKAMSTWLGFVWD
ncbi:MAG: group II intron reverse transcriptase/maturase [Deltaproteobacteria bacterium]|nr:group II intron reverse transcriptase/maturase [Deltaproteobacteria bacterium]